MIFCCCKKKLGLSIIYRPIIEIWQLAGDYGDGNTTPLYYDYVIPVVKLMFYNDISNKQYANREFIGHIPEMSGFQRRAEFDFKLLTSKQFINQYTSFVESYIVKEIAYRETIPKYSILPDGSIEYQYDYEMISVSGLEYLQIFNEFSLVSCGYW